MAVVNVDSCGVFHGETDDRARMSVSPTRVLFRVRTAAVVWRERTERFFVPETPKRVRGEVHEKMPRTDAFVAVSALDNIIYESTITVSDICPSVGHICRTTTSKQRTAPAPCLFRPSIRGVDGCRSFRRARKA